MIVTTHESTLLNLRLLRRDEIWFVEKNKDDASTVYSLEEFIPRYDHDVRKGYLMGRFGGVPVLSDAPGLGWACPMTSYAKRLFRPLKRPSAFRDAKLIIIATEDTKAEPEYFRDLAAYYKNPRVHVEVLME